LTIQTLNLWLLFEIQNRIRKGDLSA